MTMLIEEIMHADQLCMLSQSDMILVRFAGHLW